MGRKICMLMIAGLILISGFAAAEEYWARQEDLYYHAYSNCLGAEDMSECRDITDKAACPVCLPISDMSAEIRAAERNGTVVVRIPEGWCDDHLTEYADITPGGFNTFPNEYSGSSL